MDGQEAATQVNGQDEVDVLNAHLGEGAVAQDAGIGDEDVDPAPFGHRVIDHALDAVDVRNRRTIGNCFAAEGFDFRHNGLRRVRAAARTIARAAKVVDHDFCAAAGKFKRVSAAKAAASAGYNGDAAVKTDLGHGYLPVNGGS